MTPKEYNAMPEGDTKLAVRLAITMGWQTDLDYYVLDGVYYFLDRVLVSDTNQDACGFAFKSFDPFTDPSIPYGLIGHGVRSVHVYQDGVCVAVNDNDRCADYSKTHAIIQAFCAADPEGHWARFMKGAE